MAAQNDGASDFSPEMVGHAFVTQFYNVLHESPDMVYRFYQDSSTMTRPGPDALLVTATTMKEINDLILSLDPKSCKAEIMTADAQASYMQGVIVLVTGCLTGKDNVRRKFTESFFLAPQDKGGYFVLNDTFRFIEDRLPENNSLGHNLDEDPVVASLTPDHEASEVFGNSLENHTVPVESITEDITQARDSSENEERSPVEVVTQPPADLNHNNVQPVVEPVSSAHEATPKKSSWASIVMKETASPVTVPSNAAKVASPNPEQQSRVAVVSSTGQQPRVAAAPVAASESSVANGTNGHEISADPAEGNVTDQGYSVYIGNLPWETTPEQVEQEFKRFGPIKPNGIQVRTNRGFTFGFVEFETSSAMQDAIKMRQIRIGGKEAFIEEKKTTTRVVNGVSSFQSRRGGFRNDGFRGRGNFNGGRGYARNDYGKRPEFSGIMRNGNGYHQQRPYQNGGRAPRQVGTK